MSADLYHRGTHDAGLPYHGRLLRDGVRIDAFDRAIRAVVRPGDTVLDVGTGTGLLAMLAAKQGARVHAVESGPVADLADALVATNGLADRVIVHRADLVDLDPVEPVDVVLGEYLGRYLVDDGMLDAVRAAARWAKPGARWIPSGIVLGLAPWDAVVPERTAFDGTLLGLDLGPAAAQAANALYAGWLDRTGQLAPWVAWRTVEPPAVHGPWDGTVRFALRAGVLRALAGWFDATLAPGVVLSTGPDAWTHWGQVLFPTPEVAVADGDVLEVAIACTMARSSVDWRWSGEVRRAGRVVAAFDHRTDAPPVAAPPAPPLDRAAIVAGTRAGADAMAAGDLSAALATNADLTRGLTLADADVAAVLYENLGLARLNLGDADGAVRAFRRAVDGDVASRAQAGRFLIRLLFQLGHRAEAERLLVAWEAVHGPHPDRAWR